MRVSVKLVVFRHPEPARWDTYASYCPATNNFCAFGKSVSEVVKKFEKILLRDLQNRLTYKNMKNGDGKFRKIPHFLLSLQTNICYKKPSVYLK